MSFVGKYKLTKVMTGMEENGPVFDTLENAIAKADDPHEAMELRKQANCTLNIQEDDSILVLMAIPEGTTQEEIDSAIADGMKIVDGQLLIEEQKGKTEDGAFYLYDASKMICGDEWFKISTDVEGEINMLSMIYNKVE